MLRFCLKMIRCSFYTILIFAENDKMRILPILIFILTMFVIVSCVPQRKYQDLMDKYYDIEAERTKVVEEQKTIKDDYEFCKAEYQKLYEQFLKRQNDSVALANIIVALKADVQTLKEEHEKELEKQREKIQDANQQSQLTNAQLIQKELELQRKELEISKKEADIAAKQAALEKLGSQNADLGVSLQDREKKIKEMEQLLNEQKKKTEELKAKISAALTSFSASEITVENKNGKIYVSLSEKLLFKSGSTTVDPKGVEALGKLAEVIKVNPDIAVNVEGHTDNVPLSGTGFMKDNWDLSVLRATSIVRILTWKYGVSSKQIFASGRGEHFPVETNSTPEGKAKNRRTEIILTPDMDKILQILQTTGN